MFDMISRKQNVDFRHRMGETCRAREKGPDRPWQSPFVSGISSARTNWMFGGGRKNIRNMKWKNA
jgi:hypothetical protein